MKNKIQLTDDVKTILMKMAEGNPGAVTVLVSLLKDEAAIDPDSAFGGITTLLAMDQMGIYGSHIWILYKDVCKNDLKKLVAIFRAHQLGFVDEGAIYAAAQHDTHSLDPDSLLKLVQERLPDFGKTA